MNTNEIRARFIAEFEQRLMSIYRQSEAGIDPSPKERHIFDGFMDAGLVTGLVTKSELQAFIDERHLLVFDMTIAERRALRKQKEGMAIEEEDYSSYDTPAWIRKGVHL